MLGGQHGGRSSHDGGHGRSHGGGHGHGGDHRDGGVREYGRGHGHRDDQTWGRTTVPPQPAQSGIICPQCKTANSPGARFCSQCATPLLPAACGTCNSELTTGAKFCSQCGTPAT
ncbi:zinc ribbon domain-containing protein [Paraburkholderia sediminicola]|uniref:zinc ribbon domain-containing protein n=1 Tax=Paraburkholderia sediminicola TaxID=458836 RepID=UPI0038B76C95